MLVQVCEEPHISLDDYSQISIAYTVSHVFDVSELADAPGQFHLEERALEIPYRKDYDLIPGNHPTTWKQKFDLANWGFLSARAGSTRIGGAVIACRSDGVDMLDGREDLAVLWDLRVAPEWRGKQVGVALFRDAENWARTRGCRELKIETQNTNVPACKFYARQGCALKHAFRFAYPQLPNEIQLLWYKPL